MEEGPLEMCVCEEEDGSIESGWPGCDISQSE